MIAGECTAPWVFHNQHCYYVSTNVSNWADARVKCKQMAGDRLEKWTDLVTVEEADEQNFVQGLLMMTSSNENNFRATGPLWGESTGNRWIPLTKASDVELWCYLSSTPEQTVEHTIETPVI